MTNLMVSAGKNASLLNFGIGSTIEKNGKQKYRILTPFQYFQVVILWQLRKLTVSQHLGTTTGVCKDYFAVITQLRNTGVCGTIFEGQEVENCMHFLRITGRI